MATFNRTYIAGDWTGDIDLIDQLYKWNESDKWTLSFINAHDLTQARDTSLPCSIKKSLAMRLNVSKDFILVVGDQTKELRKGGCQYCLGYNANRTCCTHGYSVDYRSYIQYECEKAYKDGLKIVVLYNSIRVYKDKCPDILQNRGNHIAAKRIDWNGRESWDYQAIKAAIMG